MRVRDEADVAARIAASMAGPCPTVACVVTAATSAAAIRYLAIAGQLGNRTHTDEPHNHPLKVSNPTTHPHDHATAETATATQQPQEQP